MANKPKYEPPWDYSYTMDGVVSCSFCLTQDRPILVRGGQTIGICEPCASITNYQWHDNPGEVPPSLTEEGKTQVTRVYVLIPRLTTKKSKPEPLLPENYEFVMVPMEDGTLTLPSAEVVKDESLSIAVGKALGSVGLMTWARPDFLEHLYTAYTPRGRLAAVMMVRAWRLVDKHATSDALDWRAWPSLSSESSMGGFYMALEPVWKMRLNQHNRAAGSPSAISVRVRGIAAQYIELQQGLRSNAPNLDTSMLEIMKRQVTEDEKVVDKLIAQHEVQSRELTAQQAKDAEAADDDNRSMIKHPGEGSGAYRRADEATRGEGNVPGNRGGNREELSREEPDSGVSGEDPDGEEDFESADGDADDNDDDEDPIDEEIEGDDSDDEGSEVADDDDSSLTEGFVRTGRPLAMKSRGE